MRKMYSENQIKDIVNKGIEEGEISPLKKPEVYFQREENSYIYLYFVLDKSLPQYSITSFKAIIKFYDESHQLISTDTINCTRTFTNNNPSYTASYIGDYGLYLDEDGIEEGLFFFSFTTDSSLPNGSCKIEIGTLTYDNGIAFLNAKEGYPQ